MNRECIIKQSICGVSIGRLKECIGEWRTLPRLHIQGYADVGGFAVSPLYGVGL
jgi:hypothetical protein